MSEARREARIPPRKRLLVTGASGFIGRRVAALPPDDDFETIFLARRARAGIAGFDFAARTDAELHAFMRDARPTHLLHLAWYTGDGFYASPENLTWLAHSARLFRAFLEAGGRAIVTAGSCAEYAPGDAPYPEDAPTHDATLYAATKNALRRAQFAACVEYGARSAWGRLSFVYGPDEPARKLLRSTAARLIAHAPVELREPEKRVDFLHVDDAARALRLLVAREDAHGAYNVASGHAPTLGETIAALRAACGSRSEIRAGDAASPDVRLDTTRLRGLGFSPERDLAAGLREIAEAARTRP